MSTARIRAASHGGQNVGLVGTGMLGSAVGLRLLERGVGVTAYNRTRERTSDLKDAGAMIADCPRDVAEKCRMVITCVKDAAAVRDVAFGRGGIALAGRGVTVCDMSTIDPASSRRIAAEYAEYGAVMLDTPVMGGPDAAARGALVMMASGNRDRFEEHRGTLGLVADRIFHLGDVGTAHSIKLAMNLQIAMLAVALSEGITLTRGASIDPRVFLEILNSTYFRTGMSQNKAFRMIDGRFDPTFLLRNLSKDLRTINESARSLGLRLPMSTLAEEIYQSAVDGGFGDLDYTGILAYLRDSTRLD